MSNFHPLEVVGRGSETQLQVGDIFFCLSALKVNIFLAAGVWRRRNFQMFDLKFYKYE